MNQNDLMKMFKNGFKKYNNKNQMFICADCAANKYKRHRHNEHATWHVGKCEECKREAYLTQLRDFF